MVTGPEIGLLVLFGVVAYVGVHNLWIWLGRRSEKLYFLVAVWCGVTLLFIEARRVQMSGGSVEGAFGARIAWTSAILLLLISIGLAHALARRPWPRRLGPVLIAMDGGLLALLWLTQAIVTDHAYRRADLLYRKYWSLAPGPFMWVLAPCVLLSFVYAFTLIWKAQGLGRGERRAVLAGIAVYAVLGVNEILNSAQLIPSARLFEYAYVSVALGLDCLLIRRFNRLSSDLQGEVLVRTRELHERSGQLQALLRSGRELMEGLDLAAMLERISTEASRIAGTPHTRVLLVDEKAGILREAAATGRAVSAELTVALGHGYSGVVASTGRPLLVADTRNDPPNPAWQNDRESGMVTYLGLPIKVREDVIGVLVFSTAAPREYRAEEVDYLASFADQAAVAIDSARLRDAREHRLSRMETLTALNHLISASLDTEYILREIAAAAARLMDAALVVVWTADEDRRVLEARAASDEDLLACYPHRTRPYGEGGVGWAAVHRRRLLVQDLTATPGPLPLDWFFEQGLRSGLAVPIVHGESLLGVLALLAREEIRFGPDDEALFQSFVAQAAVAIRNASLYAAEGAARRSAEQALVEVTQLQGLLPICSYCKKIRNDDNYWEQMESYISERSHAQFSHGICPDCRATVVEQELAKWRLGK